MSMITLDEFRREYLDEEGDLINPGAFLLQDRNGQVYVIPSQDTSFHLNGMVVRVPSGRLRHFSYMKFPVKWVFPNEVQW